MRRTSSSSSAVSSASEGSRSGTISSNASFNLASEETLLGEFKGKYKGSVRVEQALPEEGRDEFICDAVAKLDELNEENVKVLIKVMPSRLFVVNRATNEPIQSTSMTEVTFSGVDPLSKDRFVYITRSSGLFYLHLFKVKVKPREIPLCIGRAFQATAERLRSINEGVEEDDALAELFRLATQKQKELGDNVKAFDANFLGKVVVPGVIGREIVTAALKELRGLRKGNKDIKDPAVSISISPSNLRVINRLSGDVMFTEFIKFISFIVIAETSAKEDILAYIAVDDRLDRKNCFFYRMPVGEGHNMSAAMDNAFKIFFEAEQKHGKDPFKVIDPTREPASRILQGAQIHRADLKAIKPIGAGQFGEVFLAMHNMMINGQPTSVKRAVKMLKSGADAADKKEFLRETETHVQLSHPNLVKMIGVAVQQKPWLTVLEFAPYGDLRSVLMCAAEKKITLTPREMLTWCADLASGLVYLSGKRLVHMDLATRNCLLAENNVVKIADFGLTREMPEGKTSFILKERVMLAFKWLALEGLLRKEFSEFSDVWSFAVVMWEIYKYGTTPYEEVEMREMPNLLKRGQRLEQPDNCPREVFALMVRCWLHEPSKRPPFTELHATLTDMRNKSPMCPPRDIGQTVLSGK
eukprot:m.179640 g.179640  ORF g.179640 m.179640 type:complete len:640 (-) comp17412_c1_seq5:477-2396(-)